MAEKKPRDFNSNVALGRIHGIFSALIQDFETRGCYRDDNEWFACELQIHSGGMADIFTVELDHDAAKELASAWEDARLGPGAPATAPIASGSRRFLRRS